MSSFQQPNGTGFSGRAENRWYLGPSRNAMTRPSTKNTNTTVVGEPLFSWLRRTTPPGTDVERVLLQQSTTQQSIFNSRSPIVHLQQSKSLKTLGSVRFGDGIVLWCDLCCSNISIDIVIQSWRWSGTRLSTVSGARGTMSLIRAGLMFKIYWLIMMNRGEFHENISSSFLMLLLIRKLSKKDSIHFFINSSILHLTIQKLHIRKDQ